MNFFIGNVPHDATEDELSALFTPLGRVVRVSIVRDANSGEPRGFGFVEMETNVGVDAVLAALRGQKVRGRLIFLEEAHPKTDRRRGERIAQSSKRPDHERRGGTS